MKAADLRWTLGGAMLVLGLLLALGTGSAAAAISEEDPWGGPRCETGPSGGEGAGQCSNPRGIGADPENGHLFVVNQANRRIEELNALGEFVKAWGWGVDTGAGELEVCTAESGCQKGLPGSGAGQLSAISLGSAVDSAGNIYVEDRGFLGNPNVRVQKYGPDGDFLLMFGGEVNKTKVEEGTATEAEENLCPFDLGDECQAGTIGTGKGQFGAWEVSSHIAIDGEGTETDADDSVYVGDVGRIQRFNAAGEYQDDCAVEGNVQSLAVGPDGSLHAIWNGVVHKLTYTVPACANLGTYPMPRLGEAAPVATAVAVDSQGSVYAFGPTNPGLPTDPIFKFPPSPGQPPEEQFGKGEFSGSTGMATNLCPGSEPPGNLYVSNTSSTNGFVRAYGTDPIGCFKARTGEASEITETSATLNGTVIPSGLEVSECRFEYGLSEEYDQEAPCAEEGSIGEGEDPVPVSAAIAGLTKGTVYHFRLVAKVGEETETGSDMTFKTLGPPVISEAQVLSATATEATLRALVNPEGFPTTYRFDYGLTDEYGQSTAEVSAGSDRSDHAAQVVLEGLEPGQTYHWQIVATNSSGQEESGDLILRTYLPFSPETSCSNQAFRSGPSAPLPDCRAYEMVSPVDKNGGDIVSRVDNLSDPGGYMQATPNGNKVTYTSPASFAGQPNSFSFNQYLSGRGAGGWSTQGIHPPVGSDVPEGDPVIRGIGREFMAFSRDLCSAWLIDYQDPPPTADGQEGFRNLYRRDNCAPGAGSLEALTPEPPTLPEGTAFQYVDNTAVQDISGDGRHALFVAKAQLPHVPEAAAGGNRQVYDRFEGGLSLVSVLPDGTANPGESVVGSGWNGNLDGAVSEDGSRAFWTAGTETGDIYVREHPEQGIVAGECDEAGLNACTTKVSGPFGSAFFWKGSAEGSRALFSEPSLSGGEDLFVFELDGASPRTKVASDVLGVLGASDDLSRVYFASRVAIAGTEGKAGEPNVYLYEEGAGGPSYELVATVAEGDVGAIEPGGTFAAYDIAGAGSRSKHTYYRATRVTPDGSALAFNSRADLTDYDNTDTATGKPAVEVYLYDADAKEGAGELHCASCNPSAARPKGQEMSEPYNPGNLRNEVIAAAWIPTWEHPNHASNVLSEDGSRLFFNASDALVPRDANGAQDVYQWEAPGTGGCSTSSSSYFPTNGGCIDLISSGQSPHESIFWEASASGEDVFFTTASSLLPSDPGLVDLYDARAGGGFPQPTEEAECEGEACQSPPAPPEFPTPSSSTYLPPKAVAPVGNPCRARARRAASLSRRAKRARRSARRAKRQGKRALAGKRAKRARRMARGAGRQRNAAKRCRRRARAGGRAGR